MSQAFLTEDDRKVFNGILPHLINYFKNMSIQKDNNCKITSCYGKDNCLEHCPCDCHKINTTTKTWQDEFRTKWNKFSSSIHRTLCCYDKGNNVEICALCGVNADELGKNIEQFISDLRKKDEEELIKLLKDFSFLDRDSEYYQHNLEQLIISHYAK